MLKKTVTYTDFLDQTHTEDFYFHLTKIELTGLALDESNILEQIKTLSEDATKGAQIVQFFKKFILLAFGERSEDGKRFIKDEQAQKEFGQTAAFDTLLMELVQGSEDPIAFMKAVLPADIAKQAEEEMNKQAGKPQDHRKKA